MFVGRRRGPRSGWPVVIDWHIDGTDVTPLQREDAGALVRVIRAELPSIPAPLRAEARALAHEIDALLRPVRHLERDDARELLAHVLEKIRRNG